MSENIKASEVSEVLRMQLEGIDTGLQFDEVGTVLQVSDGVVRIYGLRNAEANELLEFDNGMQLCQSLVCILCLFQRRMSRIISIYQRGLIENCQ